MSRLCCRCFDSYSIEMCDCGCHFFPADDLLADMPADSVVDEVIPDV